MRFVIGFLFFTLQAAALPTIEVERINGFEVHFVDIAAGNSFGVSFQVPYGSLHDSGRFLGRAHLLEHLLHVGSLRYPGYHAFDELLLPAGVATNASTSLNRTFYYAGAKDDQAELVLKVFLGMLGGLEWDPATVEKERQIVINEIVQEGLPQESDAFFQMPFTQLLPAGHPWNHPMLGDGPSLSGLTVKDLKALYNQVYQPKYVKVAVHGNFTDPAFLGKVRGWVRENLKASSWQNGNPETESAEETLATRQIPSLFSESSDAPESQKRLYIQSDQLNSGGIILEGDTTQLPANSYALGLLARVLGLELPGSFLHRLKAELGWISQGSFFHVGLRNRQLLVFDYTLTKKGREHVTEINEAFFRALKSAQELEVDSKLLEKIKTSGLHEIEVASRSVASFLNVYGNALNGRKTFAGQLEDLRMVQPRDLKSAARIFRPDQALYMSMGPEVLEMVFDPTFQRKFKLEDNRTALKSYVRALREPVATPHAPMLKEVDLGPPASASSPFYLHTRTEIAATERLAIDVRNDLNDTALSLEFQLRPHSAEDLVALDLISDAFEERYASEQTYLSLTYFVSLGSGRTSRSYSLTASGENSYAARALAWRLEKLSHFEPTAEELERARERYAEDRMNSYITDFSALLGFREAKTLVDPFDVGLLKARELALNLSLEKTTEIWRRLRQRANLNLVAAGQLTIEDLETVRQAARTWAPESLNSEDLKSLKERIRWEDRAVEILQPFPIFKGHDSYALVRFYKGPNVTDIPGSAAFLALNALMANKIYIYNRGEQQLGYVHNSTVKNLDDENFFLALYGGTEGAENARKTVAGWMHILEQLKSGQITDLEIAGAISNVVNGLSRQKTSARDLVSSYAGGLTIHRDARASAASLAAAQSLTPDDVRASARKYLFNDGTAYTQLTLHGCEDVLAP